MSHASLTQLETRLLEAFDAMWGDYIDPRDAFRGENGEWWASVGGVGTTAASAPFSLPQLADLRQECRRLAVSNEFAINGHENRISYIVGPGHLYQATIRKGVEAPVALALEVQAVVDEFLAENDWHDRQQELVRRLDRDGEVFLRYFDDGRGGTRIRFVEPEQVAPPRELGDDSPSSHGVLTDADDVETVLGYYIDGRLIDAGEIQHRKANVDRNVKRGLPLYTAVRANLRRAEKLLRNMSVVAEIQSAIALIRKHRSATRTGVEQFVADRSAATRMDGAGRTRRVTEYGPGTILDAPSGLEYEFPATGVDAAGYVTILQAELRAIAARLVMPEFMFTSDASNASYASTMVAEGPAVKMFGRLQAAMIEQDRRVFHRVIDNAVRYGRLSADAAAAVELQVTAPTLHTRDRTLEARADEIAYRNGVLSTQTWSQRLGLDYARSRRTDACME
ncbi:phage portal protein [Botrimarina mediterranea]|uniref:Phage portal protein, lambda family n=1 Tax=Botrimarina mediterranea TaxID=2528022 RepID=A0A518KEB4_9BACT|nr:phage portal protein [Botrimarina mediterranea]QDV76123.1 Phage portal protein, lambda family [Botrimarina mediterranea]QDV80721.1 Phage portal protein, lambda family [Planctomycetes bacterium K2D]